MPTTLVQAVGCANAGTAPTTAPDDILDGNNWKQTQLSDGYLKGAACMQLVFPPD